jgi:hypothetical protein
MAVPRWYARKTMEQVQVQRSVRRSKADLDERSQDGERSIAAICEVSHGLAPSRMRTDTHT